MSFLAPELWSKSSKVAIDLTNFALKKYPPLQNWKKGESILEVGFANGHNTKHTLLPLLPEDYGEFIGTDVSEVMVEDAEENFKLPRSKVRQLDITADIPEEYKNRFDRIFGFHVIHMINDKTREAFKNLFDMLKSGGSLYLNFFERMPVDDIFDRLRGHSKWGKYGQERMISKYFYSENPYLEYKKDIEAAGFKNYEFNKENYIHTFDSEKELDGLLVAVNITLCNIPEELRDEYTKDYLAEKYRADLIKISDKNGEKSFSFDTKFFVLRATK